jgi:hypothetical protein
MSRFQKCKAFCSPLPCTQGLTTRHLFGSRLLSPGRGGRVVAHGASRWVFISWQGVAPQGRKKWFSPDPFLRPYGAIRGPAGCAPTAAPWAKVFRPPGAGTGARKVSGRQVLRGRVGSGSLFQSQIQNPESKSPHPCPPPEYRAREESHRKAHMRLARAEACVIWAFSCRPHGCRLIYSLPVRPGRRITSDCAGLAAGGNHD